MKMIKKEKMDGASLLEQFAEKQKLITYFMVNGRSYLLKNGSDKIIVADGFKELEFDIDKFISDYEDFEEKFRKNLETI